jgi:hypothetical protein
VRVLPWILAIVMLAAGLWAWRTIDPIVGAVAAWRWLLLGIVLVVVLTAAAIRR